MQFSGYDFKIMLLIKSKFANYKKGEMLIQLVRTVNENQ
jgi:hypothetical protein